MKNILILALLFSYSALGFAQNATEENDPAAKAILDKIKAKYEGYKTIAAQFSLIIELPEEEAEIQKGTMSQSGNKYRLDMDAQSVICDGETIWVYLKENNEVQINDYDPDEAEGEFMSPNDLLRIYEKEDYAYVLANESTENGKAVQQIEFKPKDEDADFFKMRLTVDKKTSKILRIKAFAKDGSRFTLLIDELNPNSSFDGKHFTFDKSKYPGIHEEDLRI